MGKKLQQKTDLILRYWLAIDRTKLANERTFLSYFRTSIVFLASGVSIVKISSLHEIKEVGMVLTILSPILFIIGYIRLVRVRKRIKKYHAETID